MSRRSVVALAVLAVVAGVAGALLGAPWDERPEATTNPAAAPAGSERRDPNLSLVAVARGDAVDVHEAPDGPVRQSLANPIPSGAPLTFLVREEQGEWMRVLLPVRPNGSEGWIRRGDVSTQTHRYKIVVELSAHRITVTDGEEVMLQELVGVGRAQTPTPGGLYYTKELLQPPEKNSVYGPFAYGLSGFSNVITSFRGGEGVVGIHGTNDPASIGSDVSAGCIRMSNEGITKLAKKLPLGVPVEIKP